MTILGIAGWHHHTWAKTYSSRPALYFQPETIEQVQELVRSAKEQHQTVTVVGACHSPSMITMTTGWLVNLDKLNRILDIKPNQGFTDVTVEAGIRLYELNEILADRELALQNLGSISEQSLAGVISTGTHGSSAYHGLISEQIVRLTLVNSDGNLISCSDMENHRLFRAALLSLGKIGIIVKAVVRVVPAFNIESYQEVVSFDKFLTDVWPTFFTSAEFHRVWWYPYTGKCILWRANRTQLEKTKPPYSFYGTKFGRWVYQALLWVTVAVAPSLTPWVERWLFAHQFGLVNTYGKKPLKAVYRSDQGINMDCLFSQFVNEWALPLNNGVQVLRELEQVIAKRKFYVHAPFEIRVSNTTLPKSVPATRKGATVAGVPNVGPIHGNISRPYLDSSARLPYSPPSEVTYDNLTLNLNATLYRPFDLDVETSKWFTEFERICAAAGGKPHWAKNFLGMRETDNVAKAHDMRGIAPQIAEWYGRDLETWKEIRHEVDPTNLFVNNPEWLHINGLD